MIVSTGRSVHYLPRMPAPDLNDRIALINEDMRIYPRCLENPGPNTPNITDVFANSCAKIPAQTWMISKPYK